jgi:hypothetical protein
MVSFKETMECCARFSSGRSEAMLFYNNGDFSELVCPWLGLPVI